MCKFEEHLQRRSKEECGQRVLEGHGPFGVLWGRDLKRQRPDEAGHHKGSEAADCDVGAHVHAPSACECLSLVAPVQFTNAEGDPVAATYVGVCYSREEGRNVYEVHARCTVGCSHRACGWQVNNLVVRGPDEEDPVLDDIDMDAEYRWMDEDDEEPQEEAADEADEADEAGGVVVEAELLGALIDDPAAFAGLF